MSPLVLTLLLSAGCGFSEFSHEMNASLALCKAARFSVRILLVLEGVNAGGLSNVDGGFRLCSRDSWKCEISWAFANEFWHSDTRIRQDQD